MGTRYRDTPDLDYGYSAGDPMCWALIMVGAGLDVATGASI